MAFTVDQGADMERYQGIVPLEGDNLADAALGYFDRSEQIGTAIKLAAAPLLLPGGKTEWRAGGIVVQQMAADGGTVDVETPPEGDPDHIDDDWNRLEILLATTEPSELLDTDVSGEQLAFRLFHEDGVRVFEARGLQFACPCCASACSICWRVCPIRTKRKCRCKKMSKCDANFAMKIMFLNLGGVFLKLSVTIGIETVGATGFIAIKRYIS